MTTIAAPIQTNRSRPLSVRLHPLVKKVHAYLGLLNLSIILIWGVVGIYELTAEAPSPPPVTAEWTIPYRAPANASDRDIARALQELINPPAGAAPNVQHESNGNLAITFYTNNGPIRATVFEREGTVRVQKRVNNLGRYLSNMHATTTQDVDGRYTALRLWSYYMEVSIWSLLLLSISGLLMWLLSRPRYLPAQLSFGLGAGLFLLLYMMVR